MKDNLTRCAALGAVGTAGLAALAATALLPSRAAAEERHPRLRKAIDALKDAREYLDKADHDFNGHRKEAIEDIDRAIDQLEKCAKVER